MMNPINYISSKINSKINDFISDRWDNMIGEVEEQIREQAKDAVQHEMENLNMEKLAEDALEAMDYTREIDSAVESAIDDADIERKCEDAAESAVENAIDNCDIESKVDDAVSEHNFTEIAKKVIVQALTDEQREVLTAQAKVEVKRALRMMLAALEQQEKEVDNG